LPRPALYIVDGSSFIFRAYYAIRPLSTSTGLPTNAVYGFVTMILKLLRERQPTHFIIAFDTPRPSFRKELYAEYKANRPPPPEDLVPQFDLVREVVRAFRLPAVEVEGFEADDVIGTLSGRAVRRGYDVFIVGSDKDLLQLVTHEVRLLDTMKDQEMGPAEVRQRFGVDPDKVIEILGLAGDASDNIPGVPGIGEKTAAQLIQKYGSIEELLGHIDEVPGEKRRENLRRFGEQARLSRQLAVIRTDVPLGVDLESLGLGAPDAPSLSALLTKLEFHSLLKDLDLGEAPASSPIDRQKYRTILSEPELEDVVALCRRSGGFAVDTETTSVDPMRADLVGISLSWAPGEACYLPVGHRYLGAPAQLPAERVLRALRPLLEDPALPKYGQNIKYDYLVLRRAGATVHPIAMDTMVAAYLLDPGKQSYRLEELSREYLGHQMITYAEVAGRGKTQIGFDQVEVETATRYSAEDADVTFRLARQLGPQIQEAGLEPLLREVELPLVRVLALMERHGVKVDTAILGILSRRFAEIARGAERRIFEIAGVEFNVNSPKQLQEILFGKLGLRPVKKTLTGYSTDSDVLEELALVHPLPRQILEYRSVTKLKSTYVDALPTLVNPETGRIHTSYNQAVAATGRLSSSDPNLQNIPVRTELGREIRRAFVAEPGNLLCSADYSQIELRILAHASGDPTLADAFERGDDIHSRTAAEVFGVTLAEVTPALRTNAKAINFGILYGMGAFRLARELSIPQKQAQAYIDSYFARLPGIKAYVEGALEAARRDCFVRTHLGRRRFLPDLASKNRVLRAAAERIAINTPIQGSAADLIKVAMVEIQKTLEERGLAARMILQVHDELVFEAPEAELKDLAELVRQGMEGVAVLRVPLKVDLRTGRNWAEAH
jgi:DNA polymerase-1